MADKEKKETSTAKMVIIAVVLVIIILIYFNHLSNKSSIKRTDKVATELELLSDYDMLAEYPKTPRDVVKLHSRYFKMFYGEELTDDELVILNQQVRYLYASELLMMNDENSNLKALKKNIEKMKEEEYTYKSYELPEPSQIIYYTQEGVEMATLEVTITVDMEDSMGYMYVQYVLVKENDQWKILAWGDSQMGQ
ncbi:MAG: hypothetical protein J6A25_10780 [Lachnospiraceae bacterium]|nr:hypothetical protein [Lachnospiraceae bacterium]